MSNYSIIIFKNKKKQKTIKNFVTVKRCLDHYNNLINDNNVNFEIKYENSKPVEYEISIISKLDIQQNSLFSVDEMGRNLEVKLIDNEYSILKLHSYKLEEKIFDYQTKRKLNFNDLIKTYITGTTLLNIFSLNNKLFIQENEDYNCFVLKNPEDADRLLFTLQDVLMNLGKSCLFMNYTNPVDKKRVYKELDNYGFKKTFLYRNYVNHPS